MHPITRHLRGLMVAVAALVITAGAVLAARPSTAPPPAAADGLGRASEAAGQTVPVSEQAPATTEEGTEDGDEEEAAPVEDGTEEAGERPQNHGWFVSEAAKGETPDGFDNHGQYVKTVAQSDAGKEEQAAAKAERAAARAAAKAAKANKGQNN